MARGSAVKWTVGGIGAAFVAGFLVATCMGDRKVASLQHYSDSVTTVATVREAIAETLAAQLADTVATLNQQKASAKQGAQHAEDRADSAHAELATAKSAADSVPILVREVGSLRQSNDSLKRAVTLAEAMATAQEQRAEIFHTALHEQSQEIIRLNARIQDLTPRTPKWLRVSFRVLEIGGAFYAGIKFGQANP